MFTYNLQHSDPQIRRVSRVRLELGDETASAGVRPSGANLSDEEIGIWLAEEGDDPLRATAAACEALSRIWATAANIQVGQRKEDLAAVSAAWAKRGQELRAAVGGSAGESGGGSFSVGFVRADGYDQ